MIRGLAPKQPQTILKLREKSGLISMEGAKLVTLGKQDWRCGINQMLGKDARIDAHEIRLRR